MPASVNYTITYSGTEITQHDGLQQNVLIITVYLFHKPNQKQ